MAVKLRIDKRDPEFLLLIRNFWIAVSRWLPDAWRQPSKYIVFKGMGLYLVSHIGIDVIDRCVIKGEYKPADRVKYLNTSRERSIPSFSGNLT